HRESDEPLVRVPLGNIVSLHDRGMPQAQSMCIDLRKPTRKSWGAMVKRSAADVKVNISQRGVA
ncbi:MAG: hypothetical protein ACKPKO_50110, partial [Candidatus Fonsibacter sp.]